MEQYKVILVDDEVEVIDIMKQKIAGMILVLIGLSTLKIR